MMVSLVLNWKLQQFDFSKSDFLMKHSTRKQNKMQHLTQNTNASFNSSNKPEKSCDYQLELYKPDKHVLAIFM